MLTALAAQPITAEQEQSQGANYIIRFDPPFKHAQFYSGCTRAETVQRRFKKHSTGQGSNICRKALEAGCTLTLIAVIPGDFTDFKSDGGCISEQRIKRGKNTPRLVRQLTAAGKLIGQPNAWKGWK